MAGRGGPRVHKVSAYFPPEAEQAFADMILELKAKNKLHTGILRTQVFPEIVRQFAELNLHYSTDQIRTKYYWFVKLTRAYNGLRSKHTGVGWDPVTCQVTMSEEQWAAQFKEWTDKSLHTLKTRDCRIFYQLSEVWKDITAAGRYARILNPDRNAQRCDVDEDELRTAMDGEDGNDGGPSQPQSADTHVGLGMEQVQQQKTKDKGKGKRKTPDNSEEEPVMKGMTRESYNNATKWLHESFLGERSSSPSFGYPNASQGVPQSEDAYGLPAAIQALEDLNMPNKVTFKAIKVVRDSVTERQTLLSIKSTELRKMLAYDLAGVDFPDPGEDD